MKLSVALLFILFALPAYSVEQDSAIETFCQDLNVLHQKLSLITSNIANKETTRTPEGGYYIKKVATDCKNGFCKIKSINTPPILKYLPDHPDADSNGYVQFPGYSLLEEKLALKKWERVYNLVMSTSPVKSSFFLKDHRAQSCFKKYPSLAAYYDLKKYLGR